MNDAATTLGLGDMDPDGIAPPQRQSAISKIPTDPNTPLVCKLVADPRRPKDAYYPVFYHRHLVGPSERKDGRFHLCPKTYNENCAECDKYWDYVGEMKKLKDAGKAYAKAADGKDKATPEYEALKRKRDVFKQMPRYWLLVLPVGETKPKAVLVVDEVKDKLFGKKAGKGFDGKDRPAITGLFFTMKDRGRSPFNLKTPQGWIKMYRTGEPPKVTYHVEEFFVEGEFINPVDGSKIQGQVPFTNKVPESVLKLTAEDIIDVAKIDDSSNLMKWTEEEIKTFVDSQGTVVPERCRKRQDWSEDSETGGSQSILAADDEAPFETAPQATTQVQQPVTPVSAATAAPVVQAAPVAQVKPAQTAVPADGLDGLF